MRIPKDIKLAAWIRNLIADGKEGLFYQTEDWKELRLEILRKHHYECQECLKKGRYTRADCVHHINELKNRPDLAMSEFYLDHDGQKLRNLVPLCNICHNIVHDKLGKWQRKDKFTNTEKW